MSVAPKKPAPSPSVFGSDAAPVIFFDGIAAYGHRDGVVMLELAANHLLPVAIGGNEVKTRIVVSAHLRCGVPALLALRAVIDEMIAAPATGATKQ